MALKNLLADTSFATGRDNRFGTAVHIGFVSKVEVTEDAANVRVIMPDKVDHDGNPLNTKPIPVLQVASQSKRQFAVPRKGTPVAIIKMANGTSSYMVVGSFYTKSNPPPVTDPNLDYVIYDDGSIMQFDASNGQLDWKLKGDVIWDNEKGANLKFAKAVLIESTDEGVSVKSDSAEVLLDGETVRLRGSTIYIEGNIVHTGNMTTSGVHEDSLGFHTGAFLAIRNDVEGKLEALTRRVEALETRSAP